MAIIRVAATADAPAIAAMHVLAWVDAYTGMLPQAVLDQRLRDDRTKAWQDALSEPPPQRRTWLAVDGAKVAGFVTVGPSRDKDADPARVGEVLGIYLLKEYWGAGVGRAMIQTGLEHLAAANLHEVTLWVLHNNARAIRFYQAAGFAADGATKDEMRYGHVLHEVRLRREPSRAGEPAIRLATMPDAPTLGALLVQAWHEAYAGILPQSMLDKLSVAEQTERYRRNLADSSVAQWIAEDQRGVLGLASAGPTRDKDEDRTTVGELRAIYLVKRAWGKGIGRRLLGHALFFLNQQRMQTVMVWVLQDNARARRFYERAGFTFDGTSQEIDLKGHLAIELRYRASLTQLMSRLKEQPKL